MKALNAISFKVLALAAVLVAGAVAPSVADAGPRGRVGVWIGGPLWWPGYWGPGYWGPGWGYPGWGYPTVVERPIYVQPHVEPVYVQPAPPQNHLWYYCRDAQMYYPYVTSCPSPWQEVPATAPAAAALEAASPATSSAPAPVPAASPATAPSRTAPAPVPPAKSN